MLEMPFCKLDTEGSLMTTFWTPWGRKRWLRLPFGVLVAAEVYQTKQHELLASLKGIEPIADDILVVGCGDTDEEAKSNHDGKLLALHLGVKKLQFKVAEVQLDCNILPAAGLKEKVRAIINMTNPNDVKGVQCLVGFTNYFAKFMLHLSSVCEPLRRLLDKDTPTGRLEKPYSGQTCKQRLRNVSACTTCNEYAHNQQKETMLSHELPTRLWQIVSMDLFSHGQKDNLLLPLF